MGFLKKLFSGTAGMCGKNLRWELDGDGTLTISGTGKMNDYGWIFGKAPWRANWESLKKVIIEYGVISIGGFAFQGCESLTSVTILDSVTTIDGCAFADCKNLTSITIPDSITTIGIGAFQNCESLTSVTIPDSVITIGDGAFCSCKSLTSVTIPDSVTSIGKFAFQDCKNLTSVTIPDSVTSIGNQTFFNCTGLTSVTIPDSVTSIGDLAFGNCTSLKEIHYPAGRGFEKNLSHFNNAKLIPYTVAPPAVTKPTTQPVTRPKPTTQSVTQPKPTVQPATKPTPQPVTRPKPTTQSVTQPKPTVQPATKPTPQPANKPTTPQLKFYLADVQPKKPVAEKLTWSFAGKTLTVGGVREIKFFPYGQIPWIKHLHDIQRIVVGDGVEKIAAQAFEECKRLEMVTLPASVKTIGDMFASVSFCGDRFVNGGRNVFWCLEDGVLVLKKNPVAVGDDFSTGFASWIFADKNIRGVKVERGIKPTEKFFAWLSSHDGAAISFG